MTLETAFDGIAKGLTEPLLGMQHLLFCLIAGLVLFVLRRKPYELFYYLVALLPAYALERMQPFPAVLVNIVVALTVVAILFEQWLYEKLASYIPPILISAGFFHGISLAKVVTGAPQPAFIGYAVTATLVQGLCIYGFGSLAQRISLRSEDGFEGLENILSAVGVGVALAYFFLAF